MLRFSKRVLGVSILLATLATLPVAYVKSNKYHFEDRGMQQLPTEGGFYYLAGNYEELLQAFTPGIPTPVDYGGSIGTQMSPVSLAQQVLVFAPFRNDPVIQQQVQVNLDFLIASAHRSPNGHCVFPFLFDWPENAESAPWYSSMAQGCCASAFFTGYRSTGDRRYYDAGKHAILAIVDDNATYHFARPLSEGVWLKEYPSSPFCVLDGCLASIVGVYDCYKSLDKKDPDRHRVKALLDASIEGFKCAAPKFKSDLIGHTFSDRGEYPSQAYHQWTLACLNYLAEYDEELLQIAEGYQKPRKNRVKEVCAVYSSGLNCRLLAPLGLRRSSI